MAPNEFSDDTDRHRCPNCGRIHATSALVEIKHIFQRVAPGEPMPSGECPDCGALCQVIRKPAAPREERLMRRPRSRPTAAPSGCQAAGGASTARRGGADPGG